MKITEIFFSLRKFSFSVALFISSAFFYAPIFHLQNLSAYQKMPKIYYSSFFKEIS